MNPNTEKEDSDFSEKEDSDFYNEEKSTKGEDEEDYFLFTRGERLRREGSIYDRAKKELLENVELKEKIYTLEKENLFFKELLNKKENNSNSKGTITFFGLLSKNPALLVFIFLVPSLMIFIQYYEINNDANRFLNMEVEQASKKLDIISVQSKENKNIINELYEKVDNLQTQNRKLELLLLQQQEQVAVLDSLLSYLNQK